ncbi:phage major capsid protein, partial [Aduncisulcus paluster]
SAKTYPGGNGKISVAVQGKYGAGGVNDSLKGYSFDDTVAFFNPANLDRLSFDWKEHHIGISVTHTELKMDGLSVTNETGATSAHSGRDKTMLINMWESKLFDFGERYARSLNELLWGDGTGDAKALHGLMHFLVEDPTAGTIGGMDRSVAANAYIRNRARTAAAAAAGGTGAVTSSAANGGALIEVLQAEKRQLTRYGGNPTKMLAGSDFIAAYERELKANGNYTMTGFKGGQDGAIGPVMFDGTVIEYDPTLDDMGLTKRAYWFDPRHIFLMKMQGEWRKTHNPSRPVDQFVLHRSITSTGQMVAKQLNSALVIDIA